MVTLIHKKELIIKSSIIKIALLAIMFINAPTSSYSQEVTLTISHFLSSKSHPHTKFIEPWARKIESASNNRIKIEIFPSMTLGGKPPELYSQLRDGVADIVWTLTGYTPGVFPRSEVFELPTVHQGSAIATNLAIQSMFDEIADDFKDIKPILIHVHAGQAFHMVDECFNSPKDLRGKKLRTPNRSGAWMIEAWGAEAVGMPVPALPQALSKGVIDGALIPYEIVQSLKIHELTKCSVTGENDSRFGTAIFLFGMNKASYDNLADDLKKIIDDNSGVKIAKQAGEIWDSAEETGRRLQRKTGGTVKLLDADATEAMNKPLSIVVERWIKEVNAVGIDGRELVEKARKAVANNTE